VRKPTKRELWTLSQTLRGLEEDIEALSGTKDAELEADGVSLADILGTLGVNIGVLSRIHQRLQRPSNP